MFLLNCMCASPSATHNELSWHFELSFASCLVGTYGGLVSTIVGCLALWSKG